MIKGSPMLHLGVIWYLSEPSDVPYSQNLPRPISWIGLFLQLYDSRPVSTYNPITAMGFFAMFISQVVNIAGTPLP